MCGIPIMPPPPAPDALKGPGRKLTFDGTLAHIGGYDNLVSAEGHHTIKANARNYLWKYPDKVTWCTACGKAIEGFYATHHGQSYGCPNCGAICEFRYEAKGHGMV